MKSVYGIELTVLVALMFGLLGCSSLGSLTGDGARGHKIKFNQKSTVTDGIGGVTEVNAGEEKVFDETVLVESPGYISVLLVPVSPNPKMTEINLRPYKGWTGLSYEQMVDDQLLRAMNMVTKIQALMVNQNWSAALVEIQSAQKEFPYLTYFRYLEASCYAVLGRTAEAEQRLKEALDRNPANVEGKMLYRQITGKEYQK